MATLATETFTGTTGAAWPAQWTKRTTTGTTTIQTNGGRITPPTGAFAICRSDLSGMADTTNVDFTGSIVGLVSAVEQYAYIMIGSDGGVTGTNWEATNCFILSMEYNATAASSQLVLMNSTAGTVADMATVTKSLTGLTKYGFRVQQVGSALRARVWASASAEPSTWDFDTTAPAKVGKVGVLAANGTATTARAFTFDDITVTDAAGAVLYKPTQFFAFF
jgi:hypothetical protein